MALIFRPRCCALRHGHTPRWRSLQSNAIRRGNSNPALERRIAAVGQPNAIINPRTQIGLQPVNVRVRVPRHFRHLDIDASKRGFHLFLSGRIQLERITNVSA